MGLFGGDIDPKSGFIPQANAESILTGGGNPMANPAGYAYGQYQGGGGIPGILGHAADMDPTKRIPQIGMEAQGVNSNFQAQNPEGFAQQLAWAQGNLNNANYGAFAPTGPGGQSFTQALLGNYQNAQNAQNQLMGNLQQQAMGQGPGAQLSQNYLNQAMNQNAANAMGQAASTRGINPAMAARMAGQNASAMNAQAAGQGANMNLQSQLAAQQQLGGLIGQSQAQNAGFFGNLMGQANQQYGTLLGAHQGTNELNQRTQAQNASNAMQAQGINAEIQKANQSAKTGGGGGLLSAAGGVLASFVAHGGRIPDVNGGEVPVMLSPGEQVIPRNIANDEDAAEDYIESGKGKVPGKAKYDGDDIKNDTFKTKLASGDVVVPRSSAKDDDKAKRFLEALGKWRKK